PVAHLAGSGCLPDGFDHLTEEVVGDRSVNFDFWDECHFVFRTPVDLRITVLPAKTLHFGRRDGLHADGGECLEYIVQFRGSDNCADQFHDPSFTMRPRRLHRNRGPRIRRRDRTPIKCRSTDRTPRDADAAVPDQSLFCACTPATYQSRPG